MMTAIGTVIKITKSRKVNFDVGATSQKLNIP